MLLFLTLLTFTLLGGYILRIDKGDLNKKAYVIIMALILIALSGFRADTVGVDTSQYWRQYHISGSLGWGESALSRYELGYFLFNKLCYTITPNPTFLFVVVSIFVYGCIEYVIYKESTDIVFSNFIFIGLNYYFACFNLFRQGIAIAIALLAFRMLRQKKYVKYALMICVAAQFHSSAIVLLALIFIYKNYSMKRLGIYLATTMVLFIGSEFIIDRIFAISGYSVYLNSEYDFTNYFGSMLESIKVLLLFLVGVFSIYNRIDNNAEENTKLCVKRNLYANIISIAFLFSALTIKSNIFNRMGLYFEVIMFLWIPVALQKIQDRGLKNGLKIGIIVMIYIYFIFIGTLKSEWYGVIPYSSIFSK